MSDIAVDNDAIYRRTKGDDTANPNGEIVMMKRTPSPLARRHEALEAYLGAVVFAQKGNPALKAKLFAPYDETAKAIRDAAKKRAQKAAEKPASDPAPAETK